MRHLVRKSKLNKAKDHREAMLRTMVAQIIQYESINTTQAKAKALLPLLDKIINTGKKKDVNAIRALHKVLYDDLAIKKVLEVLVDRYKERNSGYASTVKIGKRHGD